MARKPNSSRQTEALIAALLQSAARWRYGYDLSKETGLKSGTLYPILMRLESQGWLETRWEDQPAQGRPRRHLYRLTSRGLAGAHASPASKTEPATRAGFVAAPEASAP